MAFKNTQKIYVIQLILQIVSLKVDVIVAENHLQHIPTNCKRASNASWGKMCLLSRKAMIAFDCFVFIFKNCIGVFISRTTVPPICPEVWDTSSRCNVQDVCVMWIWQQSVTYRYFTCKIFVIGVCIKMAAAYFSLGPTWTNPGVCNIL